MPGTYMCQERPQPFRAFVCLIEQRIGLPIEPRTLPYQTERPVSRLDFRVLCAVSWIHTDIVKNPAPPFVNSYTKKIMGYNKPHALGLLSTLYGLR